MHRAPYPERGSAPGYQDMRSVSVSENNSHFENVKILNLHHTIKHQYTENIITLESHMHFPFKFNHSNHTYTGVSSIN